MANNIDLTSMLEQRAEALKVDNGTTFPFTVGDKTFHAVAQELAPLDWKTRLSDLQDDARDNLISADALRDEMLTLFLNDEVEPFTEFIATFGDIDPLDILQAAIRKHADQVQRNPTRVSSRNTRKPAKRR
jgi:hypothetical protein